jgi:hypothetical protein
MIAGNAFAPLASGLTRRANRFCLTGGRDIRLEEVPAQCHGNLTAPPRTALPITRL